MDICVYVHVIKVIRCEYNKGGVVLRWARVKLDKLGGAYPKRLKTPGVKNMDSFFPLTQSIDQIERFLMAPTAVQSVWQ